nr:type II toxin-antitoxin system RelE/ParE family toxin [Photorhabdus khanii]
MSVPDKITFILLLEQALSSIFLSRVQVNYVIVYHIKDKNGTVVVLRVLHAAQQWPPAKP